MRLSAAACVSCFRVLTETLFQSRNVSQQLAEMHTHRRNPNVCGVGSAGGRVDWHNQGDEAAEMYGRGGGLAAAAAGAAYGWDTLGLVRIRAAPRARLLRVMGACAGRAAVEREEKR